MEDDISRGREAGYPECCIMFFSEYWVKHNTFIEHRLDPGHWTKSYLRTQDSIGYIACPDCRAKV